MALFASGLHILQSEKSANISLNFNPLLENWQLEETARIQAISN